MSPLLLFSFLCMFSFEINYVGLVEPTNHLHQVFTFMINFTIVILFSLPLESAVYLLHSLLI